MNLNVLFKDSKNGFGPPGSVILILGPKDERNGFRSFNLDSRDSSLYSAYHWCDPELEDRVDMQVDYGNQGLLLHRIRSSDEGLYRCRVDFKASPTRNSRVRLDVIEPPRHMLITSKWKDERVVSKVAGPFPEGAEVLLSCQVMGGKPSPKVTWWHEGSMLDDVTETRTNQMTRNSLQLPPMTRDDLLKNLTCQAVNSNLTSPLSSTVSVDLAYAIHSLWILDIDK
ncbi:hypothetical protein Anas_05817 [Armadillidium nasatum]|uniref:Ig-like domain-containing protein n=1 Tax=Armadillidium nasatum TaxID=96803 RepID=A0A5N5SJF3_9CRUS|nr:hypothetical protein Anas_05817 [Armadillidium nasatum]